MVTAVPINGSTRELILAYAQEGRSQRWIAQETGIARNTVAKIIAEGPTEGGSKTVAAAQKVAQKHPALARARDCGEVAQKVAQIEPHVTVLQATTINRDLTIAELFDLLQEAKEALSVAKAHADPNTDKGMRDVSTSVKNITTILTLMGKWCGLDDTIKTQQGESRPASSLTFEEAYSFLDSHGVH